MAAERDERPARLSYVTAGISGLLVFGLLGYLVFHAIAADQPASIVAEVLPDSAWTSEDRGYVAVDVENTGERTAAVIVIAVEAPGSSSPTTTTIDYLAGGERQRVYVMVPDDAERSRVTARVVTFQEP